MNLYNQPAFSNMKAYVSMHFAAQNVLHRNVIDLILCFKTTKRPTAVNKNDKKNRDVKQYIKVEE